MGTADQNNENAPIAFVLVTFAGLATCIGAAIVFNKRLVKLASKRFLAGSLGVAAGVMLYVSLVEIFVKSQIAFAAYGYSKADAYLYATLSLFGGVILYKGIEFVVHRLAGPVGDHVDIDLYDLDGSSSVGDNDSPRATNAAATAGATCMSSTQEPLSEMSWFGRGPDFLPPSGGGDNNLSKAVPEVRKPPCQNASGGGGGGGSSSNIHHRSPRNSFPHEHDVVVELSTGETILHPSPDLHTLQLRMAGRVQQKQQQSTPVSGMTPAEDSSRYKSSGGESVMEEGGEGKGGFRASKAGTGGNMENVVADNGGGGATAVSNDENDDNEKLIRMGVMTAAAIFIHNLPEGLATFVAALSDPYVGFALAVAIAIHNIPEGLCVAIPVYYATGNRWKAFGWALLSGVSEPIGAGLGWLILKDIMSELVYGVLFGVVAGMMLNITIHELIPTAVRYDPADKVTTNSIIAGMAAMALSLTLFLY